MAPIKLFFSHNSKYGDLAKSLERSLQALESTIELDIRVSEDMEGGTDWRKWIEQKVRDSDIFVLLLPSLDINMDWCSYELGRFYDGDDGHKVIACIKNIDIPTPPPIFSPFQAYDGDENGLRKFVDELFVKGSLTGGKQLNSKVGNITDRMYDRAQDICKEIAKKFAQARVRNQLYERRIVLSVQSDDTNAYDLKKSTLAGNADALSLLGLGQGTPLGWPAVRQSMQPAIDWPMALEKALPSLTAGSLPPALPPFFAASDIYLPVITKVKSVDGLLSEIALIFVEMNTEQVRPLVDWSLPANMPDNVALLVRLIRLMFRARWEILEPRYQEVRFRGPAAERCGEIARAVVADYERMSHYAESQGISGLDKFYAVFQVDLRDQVEACGDEWQDLVTGLASAAQPSAADVLARLKSLLSNNAKWLQISARQFQFATAELR